MRLAFFLNRKAFGVEARLVERVGVALIGQRAGQGSGVGHHGHVGDACDRRLGLVVDLRVEDAVGSFEEPRQIILRRRRYTLTER